MADPEKAMEVENDHEDLEDEEVDGENAKNSMAAALLKNPALVQALQGKLNSMVGMNSGYIAVNTPFIIDISKSLKWWMPLWLSDTSYMIFQSWFLNIFSEDFHLNEMSHYKFPAKLTKYLLVISVTAGSSKTKVKSIEENSAWIHQNWGQILRRSPQIRMQVPWYVQTFVRKAGENYQR